MEDTYFGETIRDPYRWMESSTPDLRRWMETQNGKAERALAGLPLHGPLRARLRELSADVASVDEASSDGNAVFFVQRVPDRNVPLIRMRKLGATADRTLVDPETIGASSVNFISVSPQGRYLAYAVSAAGNEDATLHVLEVANGKSALVPITRCRYARLTWLPDEKGFFYSRLPERTGAATKDSLSQIRTYRHLMTQPSSDNDVAVFGFGVPTSPDVEATERLRVSFGAGSKIALASADHAVNDPQRLWTKLMTSLTDDTVAWRPLAGVKDGVLASVAGPGAVYVLTTKDAPYRRVERWEIGDDGVRSRQTVFQRENATLRELVASRDGVYVTSLEGGLSHLHFVPFKGGASVPVRFPSGTVIRNIDATAGAPGVVFSVEGWTSPQRWMRDLGAREATELHLAPVSPTTFDDIEVTRITARSHDGVEVPITILSTRGAALDGTRPLWLGAYGAYGIPMLPSFRPARKAWLERGGLMAFAHVRGGGDFGETWHQAGKRETKVNSVLDAIACAEELVRRGYTSREHLGIYGQSAGGIVANGAVVRRPDLFAAAVVDVGYSNMLRFEQMPTGASNRHEFGSVTVETEYRALRDVDAVHAVRKGTSYPPVLFTTGFNDSRVASWQSAKMAAALEDAGAAELLRVRFDAGHGLGSTRDEEIERTADWYAFMLHHLSSSRATSPASKGGTAGK